MTNISVSGPYILQAYAGQFQGNIPVDRFLWIALSFLPGTAFRFLRYRADFFQRHVSLV